MIVAGGDETPSMVEVATGTGGDVSAVKIIVVCVNATLIDDEDDDVPSVSTVPASVVVAVAVGLADEMEARHSTSTLFLAAIALSKDDLARVRRRAVSGSDTL